MKHHPRYTMILCLAACIFIVCADKASAIAEWKGDISLGYSRSDGNTENSELSIEGSAIKEMVGSVFSLKGNIYYSSTNNKMDAQNWSGLTRYAFDLDEEALWFGTYQLEVNHDRFADVDYRIIPSVGIGYWLSQTEDLKSFLEASLGYEFTEYRSNTPDGKETILILHGFADKGLFEQSRISEDIYLYPSLSYGGDYRLKSETAFTNPISENLALKVSFVVDYDSDPPSGTKKTDTRLITSLKYSF
jgi:putative salt-induced outer membrane protein